MNGGSFRVEPAVFDAFPGMRLVVALASGLSNDRSPEGLDEQWVAAWRSVGELGLEDARKHPHVEDFRAGFRGLGVSMKRFPTSIEALLRRALKGGGAFRINPLVDFYNTLSLNHCCPAGAFDLDALAAPIELRFTREGDVFQALDAEERVAVSPGEIAYASGTEVLTRHFMWRQSRHALVSAGTRHVFLVAEVPGAAGPETAAAMRHDMARGMQRFFDCECTSHVMAAGDERVSW